MTAPVIDQVAEEVVAGLAVLSAPGCRRVLESVPLDDLRDPRCRAVVVAAGELARVRWSCDEILERGSIARRVDHVVARTGLPAAWVGGLVDRCPVVVDSAGTWCRRVRVAAEARRRVLHLCAEIEAHGLRLTVEMPEVAA